MIDKKVTRKEFLISVLSITTLFVASKIPSILKNSPIQNKKGNNTYGNYSYGGGKKNA